MRHTRRPGGSFRGGHFFFSFNCCFFLVWLAMDGIVFELVTLPAALGNNCSGANRICMSDKNASSGEELTWQSVFFSRLPRDQSTCDGETKFQINLVHSVKVICRPGSAQLVASSEGGCRCLAFVWKQSLTYASNPHGNSPERASFVGKVQKTVTLRARNRDVRNWCKYSHGQYYYPTRNHSADIYKRKCCSIVDGERKKERKSNRWSIPLTRAQCLSITTIHASNEQVSNQQRAPRSDVYYVFYESPVGVCVCVCVWMPGMPWHIPTLGYVTVLGLLVDLHISDRVGLVKRNGMWVSWETNDRRCARNLSAASFRTGLDDSVPNFVTSFFSIPAKVAIGAVSTCPETMHVWNFFFQKNDWNDWKDWYNDWMNWLKWLEND